MTLFIFILAFFNINSTYAKDISLSFDDAPRGDSEIFTGIERTAALIKSLKRVKAPEVAFYCNTSSFNSEGVKRIQSYIDAGHLIANHTHSHPSLNKIPLNEFTADFLKADSILREYSNFRRWFRFPFLHEGKTVEVRDLFRKELVKSGYTQGYVTVDNYDFYIDSIMQNKIRDGYRVDFKKLKSAYVKILIEGIEFYDAIAVKVLRRSPRHVLLLHENDLAALFIGDLIEELRNKGWNIISPEESYRDPIAKIIPETLLLNQGRVAAIARDRGYTESVWSKWEEEANIENYIKKKNIFIK